MCNYIEDQPVISEASGIRRLHFNSKLVQGAMCTKDPHRLVLEYTQHLMSCLLFVSLGDEDKVANLGLGAGSTLRFLLKNTNAEIVTVERNPAVFAVCNAYFPISPSKRSLFINSCAETWCANTENHGAYKALIVDLYDSHAEGPVCSSLEFYKNCRRLLSSHGAASFNLFSNHKSFKHNLERIINAFDNNVFCMPVSYDGNQIVVGLSSSAMQQSVESIKQRAKYITEKYKIPANSWLGPLLKSRSQL